jgi:MFS family permease
VYQIENSRQVLAVRGKIGSFPINRTVLFLGLTSLVTDISAEMVTVVLPLYLVLSLNFSPLSFGIIDGVQLGGSALVRLVCGYFADRSRRLKEVAVLGYALSALSRLGLIVGSSWAMIAGVILVDRLGKGVRTAPRDAMISLSGRKEELATSFGIHRAMDTAGAMLGPLIAFAILTLAPGAYDAVFVASLCFAIIGVGIIGLFVQHRPVCEENRGGRPVNLREALWLARAPGIRSLLVVGAALSMATVSDGFLYLALQRRLDFQLGLFPLLFVATAFVYMLLAIPVGRLADRVGRPAVFIGGYATLVAVYAVLFFPSIGTVEIALCVVLLGAYYAATDGVLMAMASAIMPAELRSTGLALLTTAIGIARLVASILFGLLWTWQDVGVAVGVFIGALGGAIVLSAMILRKGLPSE